jgi:hypothetical protein
VGALPQNLDYFRKSKKLIRGDFVAMSVALA